MPEKLSPDPLLPIAAQLFMEISPERNSIHVQNGGMNELIEARSTDFASFYRLLKTKIERAEDS